MRNLNRLTPLKFTVMDVSQESGAPTSGVGSRRPTSRPDDSPGQGLPTQYFIYYDGRNLSGEGDSTSFFPT